MSTAAAAIATSMYVAWPSRDVAISATQLLTGGVGGRPSTQVLFDHLEVPAAAMLHGAVLALAACGAAEGLVIDMGFVSTRVIPVLNGAVVRAASRTCQLGGALVSPRRPPIARQYADMPLGTAEHRRLGDQRPHAAPP